MANDNNEFEKERQRSFISAGSADYLESFLYETYLEHPDKVDATWRAAFESLPKSNGTDIAHGPIREQFAELAKQPVRLAPTASATVGMNERKQSHVTNLISAYRSFGHLHANLDPLGLTPKVLAPELGLDYHELSLADLNQEFATNSFDGIGKPFASLQEILASLKAIYCGSIGIEYAHLTQANEIRWIQQYIEPKKGQYSFSATRKQQILKKLVAAEGLERYLGNKYVGQKRFSLEGGDALVPMLDEIVQRAAQTKVKELVIGMAHRGRLNVLINILGKPPTTLFSEFEGKLTEKTRSGDVKYHLGFASDVKTENGSVHLTLGFNPSHLEIISPVVEGSVRARQDRRQDLEGNHVMPIVLHGDAAFAGQGVVMETFNLSQVRGYRTGGTLHIVINNQVGFTTSNPEDARSTYYCTDVAKMVEAPVIHVNGDDAEAVVFAAQLAYDYRQAFKKDVVIDLVCYRRHGHNESDEPSMTQPVMYQSIRNRETVVARYAQQLMAENVVTQQTVDEAIEQYRNRLDAGQGVVELADPKDQLPAVDWKPYLDIEWDAPAETSLDLATLKQHAQSMLKIPESFVLQKQVAREWDAREKMLAGDTPIFWGFAENLAYATLLTKGYHVRLSGQDCGRGTFTHRHAVLHDANTGAVTIPLQQLAKDQGRFVVIDSVLSEEAVLAFEYGYASADPNTLVIWEAQFGDFANGAQVVIDQFISSAHQKWGLLCGLALFLPHGYEGMGPEHSSARLERFLQLCAQHNMQVCVPTTPAQAYHMIRRQMLRPYRKPLVVMTPKSLLRHKLATSTLDELAKGHFQLVIPEVDVLPAEKVTRVVLCSGKVYYDLLQKRREEKLNHVAIVRIEQLYPFPIEELSEQLTHYSKAKEVYWCQEEPQNQGAWYATQHNMMACLQGQQKLFYAGREPSAAPAVGSSKVHEEQQIKLVNDALGI
jgi:2-oxoglutarate dehydrogenase E1 component